VTDTENSSVQSSRVLTAEIVAAYVSNNPIPAPELPALIGKVHDAIVRLGSGAASSETSEVPVEKPTPAQIRRSLRDDGIVSFIDGRSYKTLKRHLTAHGLDPHSYRERYGLPEDYPMVAPSYAEMRSALAKSIGLGVPGAQSAQRRTGTDG
jgi:predicted transcriptional regulator